MVRFASSAIVALLALFLVGLVGAVAQTQTNRSIAWERFDSTIDLLGDGTFHVVETQRVAFRGTYQRASRQIPLARLASVTEVQVGEPGQSYRQGSNQPGTFTVSRSDDSIEINWWFVPTTNASRTFQVSYRVVGALRIYDAGDQIYWVAVPADRPGPVAAAEVLIRLPGDLPADQLRAEGYLGARPATEQPSISDREVRYGASNIAPDVAFEARLQFPHGLIDAAPPAWQAAYDRDAWYDQAVRPIVNLLVLIMSVLILTSGVALVILRWYSGGRDPAVGAAPVEVTSPPSDLPAPLAGTVVDERADLQDVLAALVDLSNRGVIKIVEESDSSLRGSDRDYRLDLLQPRALGLRGYEKTLLAGLFRGADSVHLSEVKARWASSAPTFQHQLEAEATERGLFGEDPGAVRRRWRQRALALLFIGGVASFLLPALFGRAADLLWLPGLALLVVGLVALVLAPRMPRRTRLGVAEALAWRAFGRHLADPKVDPAADPAAAAANLPYALALGVDRSWLDRFERVGSPAPRDANGIGPVILGPGGWGYPGGVYGGLPPGFGGPLGHDAARSSGAGWGAPGGLDRGSDSLTDLLNAASEALSSGGQGGWSGGGGSGGGGSGGGSANFD
jgi:Predicted membrane protein (DUF2207) C-terminal domain/Predicted membrane protein (DUF2207) N-terminal domain